MSTITETRITSSEIGVLWLTYMMKSMMQTMTALFARKSVDQKAKAILEKYATDIEPYIAEIRRIFENEKAVPPQGFGSKDVFDDAPSLFDDIFYIMFLRTLMKGLMGFNSVHLSMSFRQDIRDYFDRAWAFAKDTYNTATCYLTEQGVLARPPYITMPKEVEFIEEKKYMSGIRVLRGKRALNTLEVAFIYQLIEVNVFAIQLMTGFAQVAKEQEVRDYFKWGKEIAKKIVSNLSSLMLDSDIHAPATWAGKATDSTIPPFSDKLMLFLTNVLLSSALGGNALIGLAYTIRSDLPGKLAVIAADSARFTKAGGKLMITHKWLEEPPQMEDRNRLINSK